MKKEVFAATEKEAGMRIDKYLCEKIKDYTRSYLQKLIQKENVFVNGKAIKSNYKIRLHDHIEINIPDPITLSIEPENIPLDILFEDDDLLIVNKPKGMVVHPAAGHTDHTLVNAVMYHCKNSLSGINGAIRPGIVHRIDMDTSGSLIICKTDSAHQDIAQQIKEHSVTRIYRGIVKGIVKEDSGVIRTAIGRHPTERKKMAVNVKNGRDAITHYQVLERFRDATYMEFRLETGRTHQIRVHMASIGHPLLGDEVYGNGKNKFHLQGQTLHAMTIGFLHPTIKQYMELQAPLPKYFINLLEKLR
ncbi:MAG: RluA family pseudouridine synthase [Eubacterium sp.]|nr:RluA family pseudouridine synthase [Eubacterium sp.]